MNQLLRPDGARIGWVRQGEGPAVVLLHGLFAELRNLDGVARALVEAGFTTVRLDLRGHGRSTRPAGDGATWVADLLAVLRAAEVERPVVVGHDLGGVLALRAALEHPDHFRALSLWAVDAAPGSGPAERALVGLVTATRLVSMRPVASLLRAFWTTAVEEQKDRALAALHRRGATTRSGPVMAQVVAAAAAQEDLRPRLARLSLPVQVLWGTRDALLRPRAGPELLARLPRSQGGPVPRAGRLLHVDRPGLVCGRLLSWLAELR